MKTKKIIKVLKKIKKYCFYKSCYGCEFSNKNFDCALREPIDWDIKRIEKKLKDIERI